MDARDAVGDSPRFFETPGNTAPPGGVVSWCKAADGTRLRVVRWDASMPRGTVVLLPGRTETLEKYFEIAGELLARNFSILTLDWRGQGASARALARPLKGHVADFSLFVDDLYTVLEQIGASCPKPWIMLAHSMGAHIALRALHDRRDDFAAVVLTAPMLGIVLPVKTVIRALAHVAPSEIFVPGGARYDPLNEPFDGNAVTHDAARFARNQAILRAYPQLALGAPTWGWLKAALASCTLVSDPGYPEDIPTPVLMLSAGQETIVDNRAQKDIAARLPNCTRETIATSKHEILMEMDEVRAQFWSLFDGFIGRVLK